MPASTAILTILAALLLGAMSPGPSFVIVARNAIGLSRGDGLATALGMGIGGVFFSGIALLGLYTLLATVEWLYVGLKVAGGVYLIYLASKIWRGAARPLTFHAAQGALANPRKSFWVGLSTPTQQSEDGCLLRQYFRGAAAAAPAGVVLLRAASCHLRDRGRLVHDRRTVLLEQTATRNLSAVESMDRSRCCQRSGHARLAPDSDRT